MTTICSCKRSARLSAMAIALAMLFLGGAFTQPVNAQCNAGFQGSLVTPNSASVGETVRYRIRINVENLLTGGTQATIGALDYALDCDNNGNIPCTDDGLIMFYEGDDTVTTTCQDSTATTVTWTTAFANAGGDTPNQFTFTPDNPVVIPTAAVNATCDLEFDVTVTGLSGDTNTPLVTESAARFTATCDSTSGNLTNTAGNSFQLQTPVTCSAVLDKQISCNGGAEGSFVDVGDTGNSAIEGCISTGGDIVAKWVVTNTGDVDATCTVTDDLITVPASGTDFVVSSEAVEIESVAAECNTETAGINEAELNCTCLDGTIEMDPVTDQAEHGCCAIEVDKQVTCLDGPVDVTGVDDSDGTETETCVSWFASDSNPAENVDISWVGTDNTSANVSLTDCTLTETNMVALGDAHNAGVPIDTVDIADIENITGFDGVCSEDLEAAETMGENTATLDCTCVLDDTRTEDVTATVSSMDTAGFDCQQAGVSITKDCEVDAEGNATATITVSNAGDATLKNCMVTDLFDPNDDLCDDVSVPNPLTDVDGIALSTDFVLQPMGDPGDELVFEGTISIPATRCNTASIDCGVSADGSIGGDIIKRITNEIDGLCEVGEGCLTHTIGFWSNRSAFVNAAPAVSVCGMDDLSTFAQIEDKLCARGEDILQAQCAAAALNVAVSNVGDGSCMPTSTSPAGALLAVCCAAGTADGDVCSGDSIPGCIEMVTDFNESEDSLECFALGADADFCNPGRNGPESCEPHGKGKKN